VDVLSLLVLGSSTLGLDLKCVSTEVVSLGLEQVGREILGTVTIEPRESGGESRCWNTEKSSLGNDISPAGLGLVDSLVEEVIEEEILKVVVVTVSRSDVLQENRADNATSTPHEGNGWLVELPAVFLGSLYNLLVNVDAL
jgi:hypothetical protein